MKIKYFPYITEQSFKTLPNGERVLYFGAPWSKPYLLPNQIVEDRIYKKMLWINRLLLGTMILGQPFLFINISNITTEPLWFFAYLLAISFLYHLVCWIILNNDLRKLHRTNASGTFSSFYLDMAKRHSEGELGLGLLGSLIFVFIGILLIFLEENNFFISLTVIAIFAAIAGGWGYALHLKSQIQDSKNIDSFSESIRLQNNFRLPNYEIVNTLSIPNSDEKIVMMKITEPFANVLRCKMNGEITWQAELPNSSNDVYTNIEWKDGRLIAFSRSCVTVFLDENTGKIA